MFVSTVIFFKYQRTVHFLMLILLMIMVIWLHNPEISEHPEEQKLLKEEYEEKFMNPYIAAFRGYITEVIHPEKTRERLLPALTALENKKTVQIDKKHGNIPL